MNFWVTVSQYPKRIVSLVPSQTEFLFDIGLHDRVIGITNYCVHPKEWAQTKIRIGGPKDFSIDAIRLLNPDLIIANKEENNQDKILLLKKYYPVWISDVRSVQHAFDMMTRIGEMVKKTKETSEIITKCHHNFQRIQPISKPLRVVYLIWRNPYMTINHDTFIHDMLTSCGFLNCFANETSRYPIITDDKLRNAKPDLVILPSEPFPFSQRHVDEIRSIIPKSRFFLVKGEMFSWYGSRMIKFVPYVNKLIRAWQNQNGSIL
ncbi:MAG: ABC transporter substrate-binding protein [Candidatus Competibacteraceae bacterium]|nr:ABC transporter substrate-binding protein [Candidatus Competibacteraceae bacterium]